MPLTAKGKKILRNMEAEHGEKAGTREFYASRNAGRISGVDQGKANPAGHYLRVGGLNPGDRSGTNSVVAGQPNVNAGSFAPGGRK
jgi:hypothetical protein